MPLGFSPPLSQEGKAQGCSVSGWNVWRVMSSAWYKHMVPSVAWWPAVRTPTG